MARFHLCGDVLTWSHLVIMNAMGHCWRHGLGHFMVNFTYFYLSKAFANIWLWISVKAYCISGTSTKFCNPKSLLRTLTAQLRMQCSEWRPRFPKTDSTIITLFWQVCALLVIHSIISLQVNNYVQKHADKLTRVAWIYAWILLVNMRFAWHDSPVRPFRCKMSPCATKCMNIWKVEWLRPNHVLKTSALIRR